MSEFWWGFVAGIVFLVIVALAWFGWLLYGMAKVKETYILNKDFRTNKT